MCNRIPPVVAGLLAVAAFANQSARAADPAPAASPSPAQCVTASQTGNDLQNQQRLRAARAAFAQCAASSCPPEIQQYCAEMVDKVNDTLPFIVFEAKDGNGNDLSAVKVMLDGEPWLDRLDGTAMPLDPGSHKFAFETAGTPRVEKTFVIVMGDQKRHETIVLGNPKPTEGDGLGSRDSGAPMGAPPERPARPIRPLTIALGGVGVAALGAGLLFGGLAMSEKSDYQSNCGANIGAPPNFCNAKGLDAHDGARSKANLATGLVIGGVLALGAGAFVYFSTSSDAPSTAVGFGPRGIEVRRQF